MPNLLSTAQAAELLGVSVYTVNRWAREGRITPSVQLSGPTGARLYDPEHIEAVASAKAATS